MSHTDHTHHADNWANPLSDYLLLRQAQQLGQQSDQPSLQKNMINEQVHQPSLLFRAFMGLLVSQLQEGHTCFELTDSKVVGLSWQNQLICAVATPLGDFVLAQWQTAFSVYGANFFDDLTKSTHQAASQTAINERTWLSALISDFDKNGLATNQTSQIARTTDITDKTNTKKKKTIKDHRTDSEMRLLKLFKEVLQLSTSATNNHWSAEHKNSVYQQLMMQVQQVPDKIILHLYEQMTLTHQLIQWLNQYDKYADLAQFAQQLMQGSAYFIPADNLIGKSDDTDSNFKTNVTAVYAKPLVYDVKSNTQSAKDTPVFTCWLHRSWQAERDIARHILRISAEPVSALNMDAIIDTLDLTLNPQQLTAIQVANRSAFSIITGGPGTGKTYTVAALVLALHYHSQSITQQATSSQSAKPAKKSLTLALAAPTGKAAQRMQESLQHSITASGTQMLLPDAKTVHRLLGIGMGGIAKYHQNNPLSEDIIIIDEASMLGAELTSQLLAAVKTGSRLILLGDAKQLAAVEAGSVLADLCAIECIAPMQVTLTQSRRFDKDSAVGQLATMIYQADDKTPKAKTDTPSNMSSSVPSDGSYDDTPIKQLADLSKQFVTLKHLPVVSSSVSTNALSATEKDMKGMNFIKQHYQPYVQYCLDFFNENNSDADTNHVNVAKLFEAFNSFRILTAGHNGIYGDDTINERLMIWHKQQIKTALTRQTASQTNRSNLPTNHAIWYHGRPIMIQKNTYTLELYNGDVGICLYHTDRGYEVYFEGRELPLPVGMLDEAMLSTAYAITVHKSQGSEFEHVALAFDPSSQRLLSRELIYTGVTRAKTAVSLLMSDTDFVKAVQTPTVRQTGLAWHFNHMAEI